MVENSRLSQKQRRHGEKNMGSKRLLSAKSKWDKNQHVIFLWQKGQIYESIQFLLYKYKAVNLNIDFGFNYKL